MRQSHDLILQILILFDIGFLQIDVLLVIQLIWFEQIEIIID